MSVTEKPPQSFAYAYGHNYYYQQILGICAKKGEGLIAKQRTWAWVFFIFIFIWLPQTASLFIFWGDMNASIQCLSTNLTITVLMIKVAMFQYHRKVTGSILAKITDDWMRVETKKQLDIMLEPAKIGRLISIISVFLTNITVFAYLFFRIWLRIQTPASEIDPRLAFGLIYDAYLPFDVTKLHFFVPMWICQFFTLIIIAVSLSGPDSILSMVILHLCGQLCIIRYSLSCVANKETMQSPEQYWRRIAAIVRRHEQLNQLAFKIRDTFSTILLIQMVSGSVSICFQFYEVFTTLMERSGGPFPILYLTFSIFYTMDSLIHLFAYCYVGDRLLVESTSLADDFYQSAWYDLAPREAKAFFLLCHRSNIPLEVKAGKFCTFHLQLFSSIIKTSMGYLSMLIAMKDR